MAKLDSNNVENSSKASRVDTYTKGVENVKDISLDLSKLKEEIKTKNPDKTEDYLKQVNININEKETFMSRDSFAKGMDEDIEKIFDDYVAVAEHKENIKKLLLAGDHAELENVFNTQILNPADIKWKRNKDVLDAYNLKYFKFELEVVKQEVIDMINAEDNQSSGSGNDGNPLERNKGDGTGGKEAAKKNVENYIDPKHLNSTRIESTKYYDFDTNNDDKVSDKELKEAGIVNRYRNNNKDKTTAILGILKAAEDDFKKSDIRSINRDNLTDILDDIIDNTFMTDVVDEDGTINKRAFRKKFRDEFVKSDRYDRQGIFNFREINKIADIIEKGISEGGLIDPKNPVGEALQRLADIGDTAKNIDYTAAHNADVMLKNIDSENIFLFMCDFDSDGVVNSTDTKGKDDHRDTGTVMGGQLYTNFLQYATTEWEEVESDDNDKEAPNRKKIVDGPKTSKLIEKILNATRAKSENPNLKNAITDFITQETKDNGDITMDEFTTFMRDGYEFTPAGADEPIKVTATADIKEFVKSLADQLNEGKDLSRLFIDQSEIQSKLLGDIGVFSDIKDIKIDEGNPYLKNIERKNEDKINEFISENELQQQFNEEAMINVRKTCMFNTMQIVNCVTELIFLDLGDVAVAGDFILGAIGYTFNNKDKNINAKDVKDALGNFIADRISTSIGLAVDGDGHPIIGAALNFEQLSEDLGNKFEAGLRVGTHINGDKITLKNVLNIKNTLKNLSFLFNINPYAEYGVQINKKNVTRIGKKPIPINRIGVEGGAGIELRKITKISPYIGMFFERDFPAGIEQEARKYDSMMKKVLSYDNIQVYTSADAFDKGMQDNLDELEKTDKYIKNNKAFLQDMIYQIKSEMERAGVFELIRNQKNPAMQKRILEYMYMTCIDAFHENAIEQQTYEQLTGGMGKLTKFKFGTKLRPILVGIGAGAVAGLVKGGVVGSIVGPGWGTVLGATIGLGAGAVSGVAMYSSATLSSRAASYVEDASGKGRKNYINIQTGVGAENHQEIIDGHDIEKLAKEIENKINPNEKNLITEVVNGKIVITGLNGVDPTTLLNIYYSENSLTQNDFCFENGKLILGNASLRIAHDIKKDKVETFLMIGEDSGGKMTKLTTSTGNKNEDVNKPKEIEYNKEFEYSDIRDFLEKDNKLLPYKDTILGFFDNEGKIKQSPDIPSSLWNTKLTVGTLKFKQTTDEKISLDSYDDTTPTDKLTIAYSKEIETPSEKTVKINGIDYHETFSDASKEVFIPDNKFTNIFTPEREKTLAKFDGVDDRLFQEFIIAAIDADVDNLINENDYTKAFDILKTICEKNKDAYTSLSDFKNLMENQNLTIYDKAFIVDKMKAILSYQTYLTDGYNDGYNVPRARNNYKNLKGPDKTTTYPLDDNYKISLKNTLQTERQLYRTPVNNLIGFTAFYRVKDNEQGRRFSLTALGGTNVLSKDKNDAKGSMQEIASSELPGAKEWFINNLKVNTTSQEIIVKSINEKLKSQNITINLEHLPKLFRGEYVDISGKMVKINLKYYFYLLAECANESIGATINNIKVYEKGKNQVTTVDGSTNAIKKTKRNITLETQTVNAEYDIGAQQRDVEVGLAGLFKKKDNEGHGQGGDDDNEGGGQGAEEEGSGQGND